MKRSLSVLCALGLSAHLSSCTASGPSAASAEPSTSAPVAATSAPASASAPAATALPTGSFACGEMTCEAFATPEAAFDHILEKDKPLVLAFGESHAQKGAEAIKSTTARFTDQFLPKLEGKAASMVLELWVADPKCSKEKVKEVETKQKEVTQNQAETNQNEFVKLGEKSKSLGIVPFILRPTCEEYDKVRKAGDDAIFEMLTIITKHMREKTTKLFDEAKKKAPGKMVLTYGGSMHNDRAPKQGFEEWSFAADLDKLAGGKYVELDLVVPEFIKDNAAWKNLRWFGAYDAERFADSTILITTGPGAYVLVFPRTR